ncbi:centromere protein P isoform X1 [Dasypus novemcinctus]|uniref:centromere protein P isoform X1 n=1 Tax=Dasypus novemcinctus TaxID=9361 RepID=UPI00265E2BA6|nr:centromere protein P isoform X1 [Dasypus novemcinctus]
MEAEWAEVRALEGEITALRRACKEPPEPWEEISRAQKSFQEIYQSNSEGWESSKDLRLQLGHLESELSFLSTLTGINIRNYSKKTEVLSSTEITEKNMKKVLQRYRLSGNCRMVTFQLEFQILDMQDEESLSSVVTDLNIIMEPTEYSELSEFVSRAEERRDLFMFFRSLHYFVEWCEYRKRTFKHFKVLGPEIESRTLYVGRIRCSTTELYWLPRICFFTLFCCLFLFLGGTGDQSHDPHMWEASAQLLELHPLPHFLSISRTSFSHSFRAPLLATYSLCFPSSGGCPSFLKDSFTT